MHTDPSTAMKGALLPIEFGPDQNWYVKKPGAKPSYPCRISYDLLAGKGASVLTYRTPVRPDHTLYQLAVESVSIITERVTVGQRNNRVLIPSTTDEGSAVVLWLPCIFTTVKEILRPDGTTAFKMADLAESRPTDAHKNFISNDLVVVEKGQTVVVSTEGLGDADWHWNGWQFTIEGRPAAKNRILWA